MTSNDRILIFRNIDMQYFSRFSTVYHGFPLFFTVFSRFFTVFPCFLCSIGYPNVGKSSLMNGLVGKHMCSTSKTPGHTKHFQTIYLSETVVLCDSPGLVFPSLVPKPLQVLSGIYWFPFSPASIPYPCTS